MTEQHSHTKSVAELSAEAVKAEGQWIPFDNHFYHGCCDCGLSHLVEIRRVGAGHAVRFKYESDLTMETRMSDRHPVWNMLSEAEDQLEALTPPKDLSPEDEAMLARALARFRTRLAEINAWREAHKSDEK